MTDRAGRVTRYFEDYPVGLTVDCGRFALTEPEITAFARDFDPQPFHVDPVAAQDGPFGGLIASGWHTAARMMRQLVENYLSPETSLGSPGLDEVRWPHPVRPGEALRVTVTVLEARRSASRPDRGIVRSRMEVVKDDGSVAATMTAVNFVLVRDPSGG